MRNNALYAVAERVVRGINKCRFAIRYEHCEYLEALQDEPYVLLPHPHTRFADIPLEGHLLASVSRKAYFVMKADLATGWLGRYLLTRLGGIPVYRKGEMHASSAERRREMLEWNRHLYTELIPRLLDESEVIVIHPGGGRHRAVQQRVLEHVVELKTTVVPLEIAVRERDAHLTVREPLIRPSLDLLLGSFSNTRISV